MPPNKRIHKKTLKLECEWGSCQESFNRMENFCKHVESHLNALDMAEDGDEAEGGEFVGQNICPWLIEYVFRATARFRWSSVACK